MNLVVLGGGIMGLAVAWAALRAGHRVTLYEQGPIPNPHGSSADQHRLIRYPYGEEEGYCAMVAEAYEAWEGLWSDLGETLYVETGTLMLSAGADDWAERSRAVLDRRGVPYRTIARAELASEFPFLSPNQVEAAYHLESGGALLAERIIRALARHLAERGVEIRTETPVRDIDPARPGLTLRDGTVIGADALIVAAGPWTPRLLPSFASHITPSRQVLVYAAPPEAHAAHWASAPMLLDIGPESGFYVVPPVLATDLKFGFHLPTLAGHPDEDREAGADEARAVFERARARLVDFADYRLLRARTCFYAMTEGERFIVERLDNAWVLGGFSGHGFKFAPLIGRAVIDAVAGTRAPAEVATWAAGCAA